jgi:hypothetical protein
MDRTKLRTKEPGGMPKGRNRTPDELAEETIHRRLVAWELYHEINQALRKVLPRGAKGSDNRPRELEQWKKYNLWPPPEVEPPADVAAAPQPTAPPSDETRTTAVRQSMSRAQELSEAQIILQAKEILMRDIDVAERPTTAKGRPSTLKTVMIAGRFPSDLVAELEALGGRKSHHLEKALRLYLKMLKQEDR